MSRHPGYDPDWEPPDDLSPQELRRYRLRQHRPDEIMLSRVACVRIARVMADDGAVEPELRLFARSALQWLEVETTP